VPSEQTFSPDASVPVAADVRRFPWIRKLAADYVYNYPAVSEFFAGDPSVSRSWVETIARVQAHPRPRADMAAVLAAQQRRRGAPAEAVAATCLLTDPRTVAVVTGQQAGLFGGPLFTLLKALTAVKLADRISRQHGVPAVSVFWVDAEDHDWEEVSQCSILTAEHRRETVAVPSPPDAGRIPIAAVTLTDGIERALDELSRSLPHTEFTPPLLARLRAAYRPGAGMAEAFECWLEAILGHLGLIVFDAADPVAKPLVAGVFAREVEYPGRTAQLAADASARLVTLGYHAQAATPHSTALFRLDGARTAIRLQDSRFLVGDDAVDAPVLMRSVLTNPAAFSPNVLLRPIVQDTLFPTASCVTGPNELGYHAQLHRVYEHFGVPRPLLYPRASVTVLDSAASRFLTTHHLPLESLQPRGEATLNGLLAASLPESVESSMRDAFQAVDRTMGALTAAVPAIDPTLVGAAQSTLGRLQHDLNSLHGKIISAAKRKDEVLRRQFARAQAQAFPDGQPQERAISVTSLLNRYGPALIDRLTDERLFDLGHHWIVTL
jgi:bacillithiol synthase